jgi:dynein heavy chain
VVKVAGVDDRPTTFIVDDRQITREDILEDVSNLLNRSEIPRLLTGDQRTEMLDLMKFQGTPLEKY